ncbi:MAG TPA: ATP-binding protein [Bacteroidales bacterium]|nr:ATP-binding protein [Bacteroidales bacterium]
MQLQYAIKGGDFVNAGKASSAVKRVLKQLGVPSMLIKRVVIALYEAEVNVAAHAFEGQIDIEINSETITMRLSDRGPGIEDIDKAMEAGYSTASREVREMGFGAGMGLPNIKKNSDSFHLESTPGEGTLLVVENRLTEQC